MSLYPTQPGTTCSLARSEGPNLPSVPRLRFRGAPTVRRYTLPGPSWPRLALPGPPSRGAKEQKVTFQLSVSSSQLWGSVYSEKSLDLSEAGGFGVFALAGREQGKSASACLKQAASGFERLFACAHIYFYPPAVCASGRRRWPERC